MNYSLDNLRRWRAGLEVLTDITRVPSRYSGICLNLWEVCRADRSPLPPGPAPYTAAQWVSNAFVAHEARGWPPYTKCPSYPVPSPAYYDPSLAFVRAADKWVGDYGASRLDLVRYLIAVTDTLIKEQV